MAAVLVISACGAGAAPAETFVDDFASGISAAYWSVSTNQPLYTVDDSGGDVRFSKPEGGSFTFQFVSLDFAFDVLGDFDVSVVFRDAAIDHVTGAPGNQVQLNSAFGAQLFSVVRSDEVGAGHNHHVWVDPPGAWRGTQSNTATAGVLRITRVGTVVTGRFDATPIWSDSFGADPARFSFSLQNNGTTDATSVTFDDFAVTADAIQWSVDAPRPAGVRAGGVRVRATPNPASGPATLRIDVPRAVRAVLTIFDVTGRTVAVPFRGRLGPGPRELSWDADGMRAGVYYCRLETDAGTARDRIVLVR